MESSGPWKERPVGQSATTAPRTTSTAPGSVTITPAGQPTPDSDDTQTWSPESRPKSRTESRSESSLSMTVTATGSEAEYRYEDNILMEETEKVQTDLIRSFAKIKARYDQQIQHMQGKLK
ncbi:hypothetical protein BG015_001929 [Linnemannia schmuckeri]|uniref:Uncharacterized protein n=1 Tax=Linnemannia schmuckeri TaxID=64567 RepID=A0A9P5RPE1_9FUNG|nr:hypothetical protein BG015_001929 [Linnemannia schmuckeri]